MAASRLEDALTEVAHMAATFDWVELIEFDTGACIPTAYAARRIFEFHGIDCRIWEAGLIARTTQGRESHVVPHEDERGWWAGHVVNYVPGHRLLVDASLNRQVSQVLMSMDLPWAIVVAHDHTRRTNRRIVDVGTGRLEYTLHPKGRTWRKYKWPWESVDEAVDRFHAEYQARV